MKKTRKGIICVLTVLLIISLPLQSFATLESPQVDTGVLIKQMELKREEDLNSIWEQLVEQGKTDHYNVHKRAYENQYNQKMSAIKNGVIEPMGDNDTLSWRRGGIIVYKPTLTSYYTEVMEFYRPSAVRDLYFEWEMGYIYDVQDWVNFAAGEVFFNVASVYYNLGFVKLGFDYYNKIDRELTKSKFRRADRDGDGMVVHYYSGPFSSSEPSAVCWVWDDYPFVDPPNSNMYDYIRYYMN